MVDSESGLSSTSTFSGTSESSVTDLSSSSAPTLSSLLLLGTLSSGGVSWLSGVHSVIIGSPASHDPSLNSSLSKCSSSNPSLFTSVSFGSVGLLVKPVVTSLLDEVDSLLDEDERSRSSLGCFLGGGVASADSLSPEDLRFDPCRTLYM